MLTMNDGSNVSWNPVSEIPYRSLQISTALWGVDYIVISAEQCQNIAPRLQCGVQQLFIISHSLLILYSVRLITQWNLTVCCPFQARSRQNQWRKNRGLKRHIGQKYWQKRERKAPYILQVTHTLMIDPYPSIMFPT